MEFARGIIVRVLAGYYFVEEKNKIYLCRGRGKLRLNNLPPLVGDEVLFSLGLDGSGTLEKVLPRRNYLLRPAVANVDVVVVVLSPKKPRPNLLTVDKLLAQVLSMGLTAITCVNKADLDIERAQSLAAIYQNAGFDSLVCSALTGQGLDELSKMLGDSTVVLAGQSGVGKSHISSRITIEQKELPVEVGNLSTKIGRGKHTTRQVTLLPLNSGGKVADTPGFSVFSLEVDSQNLHRLYPDFVNADLCKFSPCFHIYEPDCAIKADLHSGSISRGRYENYVKIFNELKEKEADRY